MVEEFREGEVNRVKECGLCAGRKRAECIQAGGSRRGGRLWLQDSWAGHAGNYIEESLKAYHVTGDFYHLEAESRSCINIWDEKNQRQTEFLEPGFTVTEERISGLCRKIPGSGGTGGT